jgi:hypothetical protein
MFKILCLALVLINYKLISRQWTHGKFKIILFRIMNSVQCPIDTLIEWNDLKTQPPSCFNACKSDCMNLIHTYHPANQNYYQ